MLKKYEITEKIGRGAFSSVYSGRHKLSGNKVAIKMEKTTEECTLRHEGKILLYLSGVSGVPTVRAFGVEDGYRFLVMDYYEISLDSAARTCAASDTVKMSIFHTIIDIVKNIHGKSIIHRDIKPANFMLRRGAATEIPRIVLIDFGFATVDENAPAGGGGKRRPSSGGIIGTPKYISPFIHDGYEPTAQDDFISATYVGLFLWRNGEMPWDHCGNKTAEIYREKCNITWRDDEKPLRDFLRGASPPSS